MKIGLLLTYVGDISKIGFYNTQEIGLAKALSPFFEEVIVYKATPFSEPYYCEPLDDFPNVTMQFIPTKQIGFHGCFDATVLNKNLNALIYFSDTQLAVPRIFKWAKKNKVSLHPYIGVLESHSTNKFKKILLDILRYRTLRVYKKCICLAKTPDVAQQLQRFSVTHVKVVPVGLDTTLLNQDCVTVNEVSLKANYGYLPEDKIILFIGRLTPEKQPLRMLYIFKALYQTDNSYRLLMVGKGELEQELTNKIREGNMEAVVTHLSQIPNAEVWKLYRIADCFVNLNEQEIFGMAILEAMYYECKVVALHAPGPDFIIEDSVSGCLVKTEAQILDAIQNIAINPQNMHHRITSKFTWKTAAKEIVALLK